MPGPAVPEWIHWRAGDTGRSGDIHASAIGKTGSVAGGSGPGDGEVPRSGEDAGGAAANSDLSVQSQGTQGRCRQRLSAAARGAGPDRLHWCGAGKGEGVPRHQGQRAVPVHRDKTVYVNHYYFYIDDEDFGPLFLKVCSYAPWGIKLCLNGHEWAKRQLDKRGVGYKALDNGFLSCEEPEKLQQICNSLGPEQIDRVFRKWLKRIPLPLQPEARKAGYEWDHSIWQMEVSLTQIFDRPLRGREFFEEIIRDNLDLGRPD